MIELRQQTEGTGGSKEPVTFGFTDLAVGLPSLAAGSGDVGSRPAEPESVACGWWTCAYYSTWCYGWWTSAATPGDPDEGPTELAALQLALRASERTLVTA